MIVRLRMQDAQKFIGEAALSAEAIRKIDQSAVGAGRAMNYAGGRGFWLNQAMFTARRSIYAVTLGLEAAGGAAAYMGFKFNNSMEQNQIAFSRFLGSAQASRKELNFLFQLAATTPFEFPQLTNAVRQFLAFGFTLQETNKDMKALSDAVAGFGLGADAIDRATLALGQMRSSGRILGQDLRQLEQLGLFSPEDFARRTGVGVSDIGNIGQLNIPSKVAIDAIVAYWTDRFGGAAKQFQRTWQGEISTLRDYGAMTFGAMVFPLQHRLEKNVLPLMIEIANQARIGFQQRGMRGFFAAIDEGVGHGLNLERTWIHLNMVIQEAWKLFRTLGLAVFGAFRILQPGIIILSGLYVGLRLMNMILGPLGGSLKYLIAIWVAERAILLAVTTARKAKIFWTLAEVAALNTVRRAVTLYTLWTLRSAIAENFAARATRLWAAANYILAISLARAKIVLFEFTAFMLANPVFLIAAAVALLVVGLVVLYYKWRWFHNLVNSTFNWVRSHWRLLTAILLGPFGILVVAVIDHFNTVKHVIKASVDWIIRQIHRLASPFEWVRKHSHLGPLGNITSHIPGLQAGGNVIQSGFTVVGERGPELLRLPRGAQVAPLPSIAPPQVNPLEGAVFQSHTKIVLDGRTLAETVNKYELTHMARR